MLLSRDELIAALFRETDRAQRLKRALAVVLIAIDGWEDRRLSLEGLMLAQAEDLLADRTVRLLRCYDVIGRWSDGQFGLVLPGCNSFNAVGMAERLNCTVFESSVRAGDKDLAFSACFGVAGSGGRSPLVVLRNAETALNRARTRGPGSIEKSSYDAEPDPASFLMPVIQDESLHW